MGAEPLPECSSRRKALALARGAGLQLIQETCVRPELNGEASDGGGQKTLELANGRGPTAIRSAEKLALIRIHPIWDSEALQ